ncbi:hypothetical protein EJB05_48105, partial [Eragrostis curvula]
MAAGGGAHRRHSKGRQRLLFVVEEKRLDRHCFTYLVFKMNLKDMFASAAAEDEDPDDWAAMRNFPRRPVARFDTLPGRPERLDLAVVPGSGGANIVAVSSDRRTIIYDTAAAEVLSGPELRYSMPGGVALVPQGTRVYAVANRLWPTTRYSHPISFQALVPPPSPAQQPSSHGRWSWGALPDPPRGLHRVGSHSEAPFCNVTAFLAAGARVWVSAPDRGTYSFDTARLAWRKDGDWELPFQRRGLFVPDLGLCFGLCPDRLCLCAFDSPATATGEKEPPAARYVWQDETFPRECIDRGFHVCSPGSLAYLGDGKFCITWTLGIEYAGEDMVPSRFALFLMAVQVVKCPSPSSREPAAAGSYLGGDQLRLVKHKKRCYKMSSHGRDGYTI